MSVRRKHPDRWERVLANQRRRRNAQTKEQRRAEYRKHKEAILARGRQWRSRNRDVMRKHKRLYAKRHPEKVKMAKIQQHMLKKYGITIAEYDAMLAAQNGVCLFCGSPPPVARPRHPSRLAIDHCHKTGKVRGLLCQLCNLGVFHTERLLDAGLLGRVQRYIAEGSE